MTGIIKTDKIQSSAGNDALTVASNGVVTAAGNVAINGASATHPLSVNGQIKSTGANGETLQLQTSSQYSGISFIGSDGTRDAIIDYDHTNGALGLKAHTSSHYINFMTGGYSERFRITDNGVTFNGDTAAANALDDYEEGTWTPTDASGAGMTLIVWQSIYTKIGRKVFVEIGFKLPSNSSTADLKIGGLPYVSIGGGDNTGGFALSGTNSGRSDLWLVDRGLSSFGAGTYNNVSAKNNNYSNNQIKLCGSYTTA